MIERLVGETPERAGELGAMVIADIARDAVAERGSFTVALTGGEGPKPLYRALAQHPGIAWRRWEVFFGDERAVATDDPWSNYRHADELLLSQVGVNAERVHPMFSMGQDLDEAARAYEATMVGLLGTPPVFDLVLLGVGTNGHTLSLFPGCAALDETRRWVVALHEPPMDPAVSRMTLTPSVVWAARHVMLVAHGASKAGPMAAVLQGPDARDRTPAQIVRDARGTVVALMDTAAAARLDPLR